MRSAKLFPTSLLAGVVFACLSVQVLAGDSVAVEQLASPSEASDWPAWVSDRQPVALDVSRFAAGGSLQAELLPGHDFILKSIDVEHRGEQSFAWRGHVLDGDRTVGGGTLTFQGNRVKGFLQLNGEEYHLSSSAKGYYWLDRLDPEARPAMHPEGAPYVPDVEVERPLTELPPVSADDDPPVVDVIVFYTEDAIGSFYTDEADIRLSIQSAVDMNNTALINSDVDGRVRLMAQFFWDYQETGEGSDVLNASRTSSYTTGLQDLYSADLVATITSDTDVCGVAWLLTGYTNNWHLGYSMTSGHPSCLGGQTFAHELGHNMGLHHDEANLGENTTRNDLIEYFATGYFVSGEFRTIMSYTNQCVGGCPRVDHFSDPEIDEQGSGLPTGTSDDNNAEVLRRSMPYVQQWREQPTTLAEASGESSNELETGGNHLWVAQADYTPDGEDYALLSGPVYDQEESWLELTNLGSESTGLIFQVRTTVNDSEGELHVYADSNSLAVFDDLSDDWVSRNVSVPANTDAVRWVWRPSAGAKPDDIGMVALADMERDDLAETSYFGTVLNVEGEPVADVDVRALDDDGNTMGTSTTTAGDGSFELTVEHPEGDEPSDLELSGEGVQESEHAAASCDEEANPCSLTATGVAREIAGQVSGMLAGESVTVDAGHGAEGTFTSDVSGVADFTLAADSLLSYGPLDVEADGYDVTSAEISSIDVRAEDATGLGVTLGTEPPVIHVVDVVDATESGFTVEVTFDAFNRDATAILSYGEGEDEVVDEQTVVGTTDGHLLTFEVSGMDCGSSQDFEIEVVNDHDQHDLVAASGDSAECSDSGSSGCTLGSGARMDPLFGLLMLLALGGLLRRKAVNRSAEF